MNTEQGILSGFLHRGVKRGESLYLSPGDALEVVRLARERNLAVVGVDAALISPTETRPVPEWSADFSAGPEIEWNEYSRSCNEEAEEFIRGITWGKAMLLLTVLSKEERRSG
jgi:hypothetical protein